MADKSGSKSEQRRSRRFRTGGLYVDLFLGGQPQRHTASDVGRHGLFVVSDNPPAERHLVRLALHLPKGPVHATACVSRRVPARADSAAGMGLQFFVISSDAKARWDEFVTGLEGAPQLPPQHGPTPDTAIFFVKLKDEERLREFYDGELLSGGMMLYTPVVKERGTVVALVVVHPVSTNEFQLLGTVQEVHQDRPRRMYIKFHDVSLPVLVAFKEFMITGMAPVIERPRTASVHSARTSPPMSVPPPLPADAHEPPAELLTDEAVSDEISYEIDLSDDAILSADDSRFSWEMTNELEIPVPVVVGHAVEPPPLGAAWPLHGDEPPRMFREETTTGVHAVGELVGDHHASASLAIPDVETGMSHVRHAPVMVARLRCNTCRALDCTFEVGQPQGPLGLFAERRAFWCPSCKTVVSSLTPKTAFERKRIMDELGGPDSAVLQSQVPLKFTFDVAALSSQVSCPYCFGAVRENKNVRALQKRLHVLLANEQCEPLMVTGCPSCERGQWVVERVGG